ncbi:proliferating cell nuclear antigen [Exophiala viscosa]|uniref:proliferating cell nuclear antigen n=1 Tax=Exophiala viscosa TaxID=2486360 RepID=UPI00219D2089|nr:proliferating cell nuclear antigen [Exophiala viscosa]
MEALIYDESPIAEYLEADAIPFEPAEQPSSPNCAQTFAPRGLPRIRERLRTLRQTAASVTDAANEEFLERFRYAIVASQLLYDDPKPRIQIQDEHTFDENTFSVRGALMTAVISFSTPCLLHLLRWRYQSSRPPGLAEISIYISLLIVGCILAIYFLRRQYLDLTRRSTGSTLDKILTESHNIDTVVGEGLRFVQEVEVVSRGYEISHPMPPISRLEDQNANVQCRELRACLGSTLRYSIGQSVEAHNAMQPFLREQDLKSYHDIYDVSMQDYTDAVTFANSIPSDTKDTLKELRFLFRLHFMARRVFLCDLLALHSSSTWQNIRQWRKTLRILQDFETASSQAARDVRATVVQEEFGNNSRLKGPEDIAPLATNHAETSTPQKRHTRAQLRRFDAVANAIRSLHAKVHLLREEMNALTSDEDDPGLSMAIARKYEGLGPEIRNTLGEWEKGRNTMFLSMSSDPERRFSAASTEIRSPASPSPSSLGGMTVVDEGPAEALRLLIGEGRGCSDGGPLDEEVFEAVALPRKRMSWTPMSREEKLNRLHEERKKRATLHEHAENTTSMLRELQMVIKHRPNQARSEARVTSI